MYTSYTTVRDLPSAVVFDNVHSLVVNNLQIRQSHGYGLVIYNCLKRISIMNSLFDSNYWRVFNSRFPRIRSGPGGNVLLHLEMDIFTGGHTEIIAVNSSFSHGKNLPVYYSSFGVIQKASGGLNIIILSYNKKYHHVFTVSVSDCIFVNNIGDYGGNMHVRQESSNLVQVNFSIQNCRFINGNAERGGGIFIHTFSHNESSYTIVNAVFMRNKAMGPYTDDIYRDDKRGGGGGVYIETHVYSIIRILKSCFSENAALNGGGFYIATDDSFECEKSDEIPIFNEFNLIDSEFDSNIAKVKGAHGHFQLDINTGQQCNEFVWISGCLFQRGHAERGGAINMDIDGKKYSSNTIIHDSVFYRNNATYGGTVYVKFLLGSHINRYTFKLNQSRLMENFAHCGAGLYVYSQTDNKFSARFRLSETKLENNTAEIVSAIYIHGASPVNIEITNRSTFYNNTVSHLQYSSAVIYLEKIVNSRIMNVTFSNNFGSCIRLSNSDITLQGHILFHNNIAYAGTALLLDCLLDSPQPSFLFLRPNTTVTITNNTALYYGGGLAANPVCRYNSSCFFQAPSSENTVVELYENKALVSAKSIYGPPITNCISQIGGDSAFATLFKVKDGYSLDQVVFAAGNSICFCGYDILKELICNTELKVSVWPGEEFNISAVVTGELNDTSTSFIRASINNISESKFVNGNLQEIQELQRSCDELTYSITSSGSAQVKLQIDSAPNAPPSFINITIRNCPLGFQLSTDQKVCVCSKYLKSQIPDITCDIVRGNPEVIIPGRAWIGNYSSRLAVHRHCPLDYCSPEPHSVDLQRQHLQCTSNRSGVLCGGCQNGLSLGLGTTHCLDNCSNLYLFLIFPFALAGLAVVFILLKCNFTVSMGTINSLIFYVNIIHVNRTIFFPQNKHLFLTKLLAVFVAWLNLDFGIETCFCKGMTAYINTWLQFVFPVYIWVLVLIMIYTSRYFVFASKIIGRNAVSVLATLFLLSYAKLLRTVIGAVSSTSLGDEEGKSYLLWLMDGNVVYFSAPHAVLFFSALLAVLLYILPLTLLTLLAPYLQTRTNHRMMRWVVRIKPLLDAYQGPYKDNHRHWTGVMLLLRMVLFVVFSANTLGNPNINVFSISVPVIALYLYQIWVGRLYKTRLNQFLEGFYSGNLCLFAIGILFLNASQGSSEALACVMVGSAFLVFCFVVVWHFNDQTRAISRAGERLKQLWTSWRRRQAEDTQEPPDPPPRQPQPTVSVIDMKELREQEN